MDIFLRRRCLSTKLSFRALAQIETERDEGVINMLTMILIFKMLIFIKRILIAPNAISLSVECLIVLLLVGLVVAGQRTSDY